MNILILSSSSPNKAAGIVAKDLLNTLRKINDSKVKLLVENSEYFNDPDILAINSKCRYYYNKSTNKLMLFIKQITSNKRKKKNKDYNFNETFQNKTIYKTKKILEKTPFKPDKIIVLFTNFLTLKNIFELNKLTNAPVFLYLMDMAFLTGGCHYAWDCKGYENQCGKCPALFSENVLDQSYINWKFKKEYIKNTNIEVIAASEWTSRQLNNCSLFQNKKKHKILLNIDNDIFKPANKDSIRNEIGLPLNKKIILFGAVNPNIKRKGFVYLVQALNILNEQLSSIEKEDIHFAIVGNSTELIIKNFPFNYTSIGFLSHNELPKAFQAADIFLSTSIEDSGPMMVNQSIMCGTPVVAFEMGVAIDLVITGETGYKARLKDSKDLTNGIKDIIDLDAKEYKKMSENCRKLGLELCHPQKQSNKFIEILTSI